MTQPSVSRIIRGCACIAALVLTTCAPKYTLVNHVNEASAKSDSFGYRKWISETVDPDVVIIGIHGFCGASIDYANLGNHLLQYQPKTGLYAYEVRGQGSDPIRERRGDIGDPKDWYRDLFAFTQLVREQHPHAKIVWFGESMGALISVHALREAPAKDPLPDGLILSSPIVRFRDDIPAWTPGLVQIAATTLPLARISLETLSGGQDIQMTQTSHHNEQVQKNSYNVEKHTLRLIGTLGRHIDTMNDCAATFRQPVLVLHGGKDYFNNDSDVRGFVARIPSGVSKTYHDYPQAYHLLMYDAKRETIFRDIERWVNLLRNDRLKKL
ncbi:MAG: alpha/beta fold hydrolase [Luteolibacter sp.]|uniref:alpha/beta fold hydrolase n=1 Tax=Luteolibacter sp. TaxID=1962973 RepID=UPI003264EB21